MNTIEQLRAREQTLKEDMAKLLKSIRKDNGIPNPFVAARELSLSQATLRNIESGISFPTNRTLSILMKSYRLTPHEKTEALRMKTEMLALRRQMKQIVALATKN